MAVTAPRAVLTFPAHVAAVSVFKTATETVSGLPTMSSPVTTTVALPLAVIVPAAVAVST